MKTRPSPRRVMLSHAPSSRALAGSNAAQTTPHEVVLAVLRVVVDSRADLVLTHARRELAVLISASRRRWCSGGIGGWCIIMYVVDFARSDDGIDGAVRDG
jgi:hypothetical protein